ncbi:MAG: EamA family transporter [Actinobacteria bacterium]|nr:EamA family transporter [Actinomycetota bacterium]
MTALLALLSSILWGSSDFLGGMLSKRLPPFLVVAISQVAGLIAIVGVALTTGAWQAPTGYLPWAVIAGWSGAAGMVIFYRALATGTMGVVAPISGLSGVVPLLAGLFAGERFTPAAAVGAAAIGVGVLLASGPELHAEAGWRPLILALVAALLFGVTLLAIARGSEYSAVMTMVGMRVSQIVVFAPVALVIYRRLRAPDRASIPGLLPLIAAIGLLDVGANLTYGLSADLGPLVVVAVLGSLYPVVTAVLAAVVLRERLRGIQYAGVAAAIGGLMLLTLG